MRRIKKALAALAIVCLFVPCISLVTHAASAELRFTDPSTTVGAEVEVTAKFTAPVLMDSLEATLTYDSSKLRFVSGDSATGGDGTVTISGNGGSATEASFTLTFQALAEGTMERHSTYNDANENYNSLAAWYMTKDDQKMLVMHNFGNTTLQVPLIDRVSKAVGTSGEVKQRITEDGQTYVLLGAYSSVVYLVGE